ncbi:P-loop containing nucleoside triphosphate hydrolase protein [Russula earlei]|uniref:P-loop containing nucleoside triphosphate hydrolase protein n=1 Tax=Russula earlei TaxID=71964 RepID=A0ACC0U988_9AGAM|nr:P-loop containing nucleoside triphosphate hydrolase protein [Russula earlei]
MVARRWLARSPFVVRIPNANVYRFGDPDGARPVLTAVDWTVREGESWAVVGSGVGEKTALLEALLGNMRISPPPPGGPLPSLSLKPRPINDAVFLVSFAQRPRASVGAFYDYTARYGAVRDEDRVTLRQSMFPEASDRDSIMPFIVDSSCHQRQDMSSKVEERARRFDELTDKLGLKHLLDLPLVTLSNGQTRRARIVKALIEQPDILLLDEPLTGLDFKTRPALLSLLHSFHASNNPRVIMGLRLQDPIPEWITHMALVHDGQVETGERTSMLEKLNSHNRGAVLTAGAARTRSSSPNTVILVDMQNVNVRYHERHVLRDINWSIRAGDRWHLQGANGSGKTTLLSVLTGDHPQSYTQRAPKAALMLFGAPRRTHATPHLRARIGVVSPELYNAWPRGRDMTVWEAVATGFDGGFVPLGPRGLGVGLQGELSESERTWRADRVWEVIRGLGPHTWGGAEQGAEVDAGEVESVKGFAERPFAALPAGVQSIVLLMRALVGRPSLVLLDEVWSGMDDRMIQAARAYLRGDGLRKEQAVVVVSHWEDEVPWGIEDGVKTFRLEEGEGTVLE